jgi:hypothetical protein
MIGDIGGKMHILEFLWFLCLKIFIIVTMLFYGFFSSGKESTTNEAKTK